MEYVYTAMLLHSAKKDISEGNVSTVLKAAGIQEDSSKIKALVASLKDLNIEEAIKQAAVAQVAVAAPAQAATAHKEEKKEDDGKAAEAAAEGLGSLFG